MENLHHLASLLNKKKAVFFNVLTFSYFLVSLVTSVIGSTYLSNVRENKGLQALAFLTLFRLILPEATPLKKYLHRKVLLTMTVLLPLLAHLPLYLLVHVTISDDRIACKEPARNRITLHFQQEQFAVFNRRVVTYHNTASKVESLVKQYLLGNSLFPINTNALEGDQELF